VNRSDVERAKAEAGRFITACDQLLASEVSTYVRRKDGSYGYETRPWSGAAGSSKDAASVKRASLDLSRSLSHMRRRS